MLGEAAKHGFMTRRQLLKRLGVAGGSALVMGVMDAWDLSAKSAGQRPRWTGDRQGTRVAVLGAGISGLVTAYELRKLGYEVQVLEARDRVGGLCWSVRRGMEHTELDNESGPGERQVCDFAEGEYFNAGPWRLPNDHEGILGYCTELGVALERFNNENTAFYNRDPAGGPLANKLIHLREVESDLWGGTAELIAKVVAQGALDNHISTEDKERLIEFLARAGFLDTATLMYQPNEDLRGSGDPYDLSALLSSPFAREIRAINSGSGGPMGYFQPVGGMMQIPLAFDRELGDRITYQAEVTRVSQTEDEVSVAYLDTATGDTREVTADYVAICLPMSILKKLDVDLLPDVAAAVEANNHSSSSKMGFQMARRFWEEEEDIFGGHLRYTDLGAEGRASAPLPQFSYPSEGFKSQKGVLLGYYGNPMIEGPSGRPLIDSPIADRFEHVLQHASNVHPQMREEFEAAYAVMWPRVKYSEGAWAGHPPEELIETMSQASGRIYIGGAGSGDNASWQEGAVATAWRTVESIHSRVGAA